MINAELPPVPTGPKLPRLLEPHLDGGPGIGAWGRQALWVLAAWCFGLGGLLAAEAPAGALPRSAPEAQGIPSKAILAFVERAEREITALHGLVLVRHGQVVAEGYWAPYNSRSPHELYSLSKSFTSTAVGLAIGEGKLSVDDEVLKFFPADAPAQPSDNLKAMRVRDLLCMSTGQQDEAPTAADRISAKAFLAQPVPFKPGTHFKYNTPATYMLSAIVQKVTGQTVLDYLRPRLFAPLGIEHPTWGASAEGVTLGGYGLRVRTEDIARFGQLYLQHGQWHGQQVVPAAWVEVATARQTSNGSNPKSDWDQGYGYQFWRCRHGAYRGDGAFGQYCVVMPERDTVLAITSGVKDMQQVLNVFWDTLFPAFQTAPLAADPASEQQLAQKLGSLMLLTQAGSATSPLLAKIAGRKYVFPSNPMGLEALTLNAGHDGKELTIVERTSSGAELRVECGHGEWKLGRLPFNQSPDEPVAASGAWLGEDTFAVKLRFYETPSCLTVKLQYAGDQLNADAEVDVAFGPSKYPRLVGQAQ